MVNVEQAAPLVSDRAAPSNRARAPWRETIVGYTYLLPALIILVGFHFLPLLYAAFISLFNWRIRQGAFLGLGNYERVLADADFWNALKVSVFYAAGIVPANLLLSFLIAYALFQRIRGRQLYRLVYFLPYITAAVAAALVWRWIFHSQYGLLNFVLGKIGIPAQQWLLEPRGVVELLMGGVGVALPEWAGGPGLALVSIMVFAVWHSLGFSVVIMLAGLSNIPREMYEAARMDGAGELSLMRHITLPLLSPTLFFLTIVSTIEAFQSFNSIYVMTSSDHGNPGGPLGTTTNITMYIFLNFFAYTRLGYASAIAFVLLFIVLVLTILQLRVLGRRVHYQ